MDNKRKRYTLWCCETKEDYLTTTDLSKIISGIRYNSEFSEWEFDAEDFGGHSTKLWCITTASKIIFASFEYSDNATYPR